MVLSIITINYNNVDGLRETLRSVLYQTFKSFEYIVIDGGSIDGSKELLENSNSKIDYWISEKDAGIYNAMNKGISVAKGKYILFLNSGDSFVTDTVLADVNIPDRNEDVVFGDVLLIYDKHTEKKIHPDVVDFEYMVYNTLSHPVTFIKRNLFLTIGLYDVKFRISSDWFFFMKCLFRYNCSYKHVDLIVAKFDMHGLSNNPKFKKIHQDERENILLSNFNSELTLFENYQFYKNKFQQVINHPFIRPLLKMKIGFSKIFSK